MNPIDLTDYTNPVVSPHIALLELNYIIQQNTLTGVSVSLFHNKKRNQFNGTVKYHDIVSDLRYPTRVRRMDTHYYSWPKMAVELGMSDDMLIKTRKSERHVSIDTVMKCFALLGLKSYKTAPLLFNTPNLERYKNIPKYMKLEDYDRMTRIWVAESVRHTASPVEKRNLTTMDNLQIGFEHLCEFYDFNRKDNTHLSYTGYQAFMHHAWKNRTPWKSLAGAISDMAVKEYQNDTKVTPERLMCELFNLADKKQMKYSYTPLPNHTPYNVDFPEGYENSDDDLLLDRYLYTD